MRAATEGSLPPVMAQGNLVEVLGREVRQGSPSSKPTQVPQSTAMTQTIQIESPMKE